jgi:hypothetical protein
MTEINQEDYFKQSYFPRMFVNPQFVGFICENGCTGPSGKSFGWPAKIDHALRFPVYCPRCLSLKTKMVGIMPCPPENDKFAFLYDPRTMWKC